MPLLLIEPLLVKFEVKIKAFSNSSYHKSNFNIGSSNNEKSELLFISETQI